jgi:hypothetical protein
MTARPPVWLVAATCILALGSLAMAVAETSLWMHYLIDAGEYVSLAGLAFILLAGLYLFRQQRLAPSLPLTLPWLLLPVITQGDQIIDNLSINWMRFICHVLLGLLFGAPVAVIASMMQGVTRKRRIGFVAVLLLAEMWIAYRFLGMLMILTLALMLAAVLMYAAATSATGSSRKPRATTDAGARPWRGERAALGVLVAGVALSCGLYVVFKNRPGAYQGSPSYYMDPAQRDGGFQLAHVSVPSRVPAAPADPAAFRAALTGYARALERLLAGYYVLDRNYNYDFHNRLFLRHTPLLPDYRRVGLAKVREGEALRADADSRAAALRPTLAPDDPLAALLDDVRAYAAFTFGRAPMLERMSADFELTEAGLQHATHLYEGEGKMLGERLGRVLEKHDGVLTAPEVLPVTADFVALSRSVRESYANRIVGF